MNALVKCGHIGSCPCPNPSAGIYPLLDNGTTFDRPEQLLKAVGLYDYTQVGRGGANFSSSLNSMWRQTCSTVCTGCSSLDLLAHTPSHSCCLPACCAGSASAGRHHCLSI